MVEPTKVCTARQELLPVHDNAALPPSQVSAALKRDGYKFKDFEDVYLHRTWAFEVFRGHSIAGMTNHTVEFEGFVASDIRGLCDQICTAFGPTGVPRP